MQVFTGRKPDELLVCRQPHALLSKHAPISNACAREVAKLSDLPVALEAMRQEEAQETLLYTRKHIKDTTC